MTTATAVSPEAAASASAGRIVERGQSVCRGDLYDFSFVVTRPAG